jgi:uncharacterized integral membrane protein
VKLAVEGEKRSMRILNILCGLAVLFMTLHFAHLLHHFLVHNSDPSAHTLAFWAAFAGAVVVGIFSFVGGCLLLRGSR